jgi:hypothetical protein
MFLAGPKGALHCRQVGAGRLQQAAMTVGNNLVDQVLLLGNEVAHLLDVAPSSLQRSFAHNEVKHSRRQIVAWT